jgi:hypothetical protein
MIRVFRYSIDNDMRMIRVDHRYPMLRYTRAILYFLRSDLSYFCLKNEYNEDKFNGHMQCSERRKWHSRASNFKNFPGGMPPDPPTYARSLKMLRSDFWLDPPLIVIKYNLYSRTEQGFQNNCKFVLFKEVIFMIQE